MEQTLVLKNKGLYTLPNEYNTQNTPDGALTIADNVVIDKDNVVEPRRGFQEFISSLTNVRNLYFYQGKCILHYDTDKLGYFNGTNVVNYTESFNTPDSKLGRIRFVEGNSNLYFKTNKGVYKLDKYDNQPTLTGVPKSLDIELSLDASVTGFFTPNSQVAYRCVWGIKDANNNLKIGAPSQRSVLVNPSAGSLSNVDITITIPRDITTDFFFQVYRSELSVDDITEPSDELYLVYEANPTGTDITNGYITFTDLTPTSLVGATLYTSPSQEGILQSNERPPFAKDIEQYKNHLFYANTISKHRYFLNLLAAGGTSGLGIDDTITIAGLVYTGKASEDIANREFKVTSTGVPSVDIRETCLSLIRVVNRTVTNNPVNMFYLSGVDDLAGKMLIEEAAINGSSFNVQSSKGAAFSPNIASAKASTNDILPNGLYISKIQQPEAVPLVNQILVGNKANEIKRIKTLRDSLFIFKDDGIFRITGDTTSNFRVDLLDSTTKLIAPDSVVSLNNQIYALTNQGVVSVSDTGVATVSRNIENIFFELLGKDKEALAEQSFAIAYESDRKYILFTIQNENDTICKQAYVYNVFTNAWTRWLLEKSAGIVNPDDDLLYIADSLKISKERKAFNFTDYADESFAVSCTSITGRVLTLDSVNGIFIGDLAFQSETVFSLITEIDLDNKTITIISDSAFTTGDVHILKAIPCKIEYSPNNMGNISLLKHIRECQMLFKYAFLDDFKIGFNTNLSTGSEYVICNGQSQVGWGLTRWGNDPWGGVFQPITVRTYIPRDKQYCSYIKVIFEVYQGYGLFGINGVNLTFRGISERVLR